MSWGADWDDEHEYCDHCDHCKAIKVKNNNTLKGLRGVMEKLLKEYPQYRQHSISTGEWPLNISYIPPYAPPYSLPPDKYEGHIVKIVFRHQYHITPSELNENLDYITSSRGSSLKSPREA